MKSFKNYTPDQTRQTPPTAGSSQTPPPDVENFARQIIGEYEGKSGVEMLRSVLKQAEAAKRAGTLTNDQIDEFYMQFSPMLNSLQRKKLQEIVDDLKKL